MVSRIIDAIIVRQLWRASGLAQKVWRTMTVVRLQPDHRETIAMLRSQRQTASACITHREISNRTHMPAKSAQLRAHPSVSLCLRGSSLLHGQKNGERTSLARAAVHLHPALVRSDNMPAQRQTKSKP
jgi:hypothetical protein